MKKLIERGGGIGPVNPRQPQSDGAKSGKNESNRILEDESAFYKKLVPLIIERFFLTLNRFVE